jgi:hypothetical protein
MGNDVDGKVLGWRTHWEKAEKWERQVTSGNDVAFIYYPQKSVTPPSGKDITQSFVDPNFLAAVREVINKPDGPILDYDVSRVTVLYLQSRNIYRLDGIEHFASLQQLFCDWNHLSELDLTGNRELIYLNCSGNQLPTLNLSECTELTTLLCSSNKLTSLDLSNNLKLEFLSCSDNYLLSETSIIGLDAIREQLEFYLFYPQNTQSYVITFNANGGTVIPETAKTETDGRLTSLPIPTHAGDIFIGWFTAAEGGTPVSTDYVFTADTPIFARWSIFYGDVDGNGAITLQDSLYLARYLAGWPEYQTITMASDADGNGVIDSLDSLCLARHLAGWEGYETLGPKN